ncbi:ATP-binding cassette domain-containing protein [Actinomadura sp. WAC 06369]|uniref:ATP-binding cassette domain-containing protein n=1 Tax=Actinomadura sp. WAC 06369 TaxID=2203193 RepID=UPI000F777F9E|nr:ATP-binding cassette domain-containing protein [Actinomadura sp. WAC 06369]RSN60152.1 daunorubicin/doxorubicin resistance ABC transporter ATP-binding protein DrrA [Actinomadura sp. WAC 06369]
MDDVIRTEALRKRFGETQALDGVSIAVRRGSVLGVLGPNGAGKTTAVRVLATLLKPDSGRAEVCGYDVVRDAVRVRAKIGLTGQYASVDEELSGTQNLVMIARLLDFGRAEAKARARELLARFRLAEAGRRAVKTYSGGMRRRLDLAASLINRPDVIYLDEPTTGLDPRARNEVWETVRAVVADGATVLLTTQYLEEADALADRIAVFDHGRVIAEGTSGELKRRVGRQTLTVRAAEPYRVEQLTAIVAEVAGGRPDVQAATGLVTAPVSDPGAVSALVRRLDEAALTPAELAVRMPSLDEVFLTLTGHAAEEPADEPAREGSLA